MEVCLRPNLQLKGIKGHSAVIDFGCVRSIILWVKFKFPRVKVCVVVVYNITKGKVE